MADIFCLPSWSDHNGTVWDKAGYMQGTNNDAVMERVDDEGNVPGFTVMQVSRLSKQKPLIADLVPASR